MFEVCWCGVVLTYKIIFAALFVLGTRLLCQPTILSVHIWYSGVTIRYLNHKLLVICHVVCASGVLSPIGTSVVTRELDWLLIYLVGWSMVQPGGKWLVHLVGIGVNYKM